MYLFLLENDDIHVLSYFRLALQLLGAFYGWLLKFSAPLDRPIMKSVVLSPQSQNLDFFLNKKVKFELILLELQSKTIYYYFIFCSQAN